MVRKRLLLLLKPLDVYPVRRSNGLSRFTNPRIIHHLDNRRKVHKDAIDFCQRILQQKSVDWEPVFRNNLTKSIHDVDLVVTVGGDGTLLQASHLMGDSIPVLGMNSDPTKVEEVEEFGNEFNATRSTGYLCAATFRNFEQVRLFDTVKKEIYINRCNGALRINLQQAHRLLKVLDDVLEDRTLPSKLTRISICINSQPLSTYALNDILIAHPCPAAVSRLSFKIRRDGQPCSPLVNCRSSGLRACTAAGSTAAMISAGGFPMPILSQDLQYMVREPISPGVTNSSLMHGLIKYNQYMDTKWFSEEGRIYIDGSHVFHAIQDGDSIEVSSKAPVLHVFLPDHLLL